MRWSDRNLTPDEQNAYGNGPAAKLVPVSLELHPVLTAVLAEVARLEATGDDEEQPYLSAGSEEWFVRRAARAVIEIMQIKAGGAT